MHVHVCRVTILFLIISCFFHFFLREFKLMVSISDDSSLLLDQDTN